MSIPTIRADWAQHMVWGGALAAVAASACAAAGVVLDSPGLRLAMPAAAVVAALVAGVVKEAADWLAARRFAAKWRAIGVGSHLPHEVSSADLAATVLGGVFVAVPVFLALWGGR